MQNLLPATCYLLPATCYLLPATCYLLPSVSAIYTPHTLRTDLHPSHTDLLFAIDTDAEHGMIDTGEGVFESGKAQSGLIEDGMVDMALPHRFEAGEPAQSTVWGDGFGLLLEYLYLLCQLFYLGLYIGLQFFFVCRCHFLNLY